MICSGLTAHLLWVPATFRLCSQHFTVKLWLPQMLPNFGYGRQIMPTDVKKQGLPQMSANRPNIGSIGKIDLRKLSKGVSSRTLFVFPVFFHLCFRCFFMFFRFFCFQISCSFSFFLVFFMSFFIFMFFVSFFIFMFFACLFSFSFLFSFFVWWYMFVFLVLHFCCRFFLRFHLICHLVNI